MEKQNNTVSVGRGVVRGFTLIEMIVSIGAFAVLMLSLTSVFSSGFHSFGSARQLERNEEVAQYSLNTLAKYLRTSSVVNSSTSDVLFYDYSSKRCFEYQLDSTNGILKARWKDIATITNVMTDCSTSGMNGWVNLTTGWVTGRFVVVSSNPSGPSVGRVTINLSVSQSSASSAAKTNIQTTVSLRDYDYVLGN